MPLILHLYSTDLRLKIEDQALSDKFSVQMQPDSTSSTRKLLTLCLNTLQSKPAMEIGNSIFCLCYTLGLAGNSPRYKVNYKCNICSCKHTHNRAKQHPIHFRGEEVHQEIPINHYHQCCHQPCGHL